jgi:hypothetical protein
MPAASTIPVSPCATNATEVEPPGGAASGWGVSPTGAWPTGETPRHSGDRGYARLVARSWYSTPMKKPQIRCHTSTANGSFHPSGPSNRNRP